MSFTVQGRCLRASSRINLRETGVCGGTRCGCPTGAGCLPEVLAHAMAAASVNTRLGEGEWEMEVLVSPHISRQRGRRVRNRGAAAGLRGGEPLQTVTRAKTDFGLTEGKGKCRAAFTPAANLAVGSLFSFFFKMLDENACA